MSKNWFDHVYIQIYNPTIPSVYVLFHTSPKDLQIGWWGEKWFGKGVAKLKDSWNKRLREMISSGSLNLNRKTVKVCGCPGCSTMSSQRRNYCCQSKGRERICKRGTNRLIYHLNDDLRVWVSCLSNELFIESLFILSNSRSTKGL